MSTVTRSAHTIAGVPGMRFATAARPGSPEEEALKKIQYTLSDGQTSLPDPTTVAHLALSQVRVTDGSSYPVITLWVPAEQESEAVAALRAAGFEVE
ncbi:hypothetical protein [Jatrophihabitans sp.]|uniref:hypothetical protein n=1 Tax=Jatrophihabitans sp. TaxID=1932789 RepID=UPI002BC94CCC|nr:hypothetical protein [Jatrophihabitans sp.]